MILLGGKQLILTQDFEVKGCTAMNGSSPPQVHVQLEPVNVTLFGIGSLPMQLGVDEAKLE